jgi:hypothetical protein
LSLKRSRLGRGSEGAKRADHHGHADVSQALCDPTPDRSRLVVLGALDRNLREHQGRVKSGHICQTEGRRVVRSGATCCPTRHRHVSDAQNSGQPITRRYPLGLFRLVDQAGCECSRRQLRHAFRLGLSGQLSRSHETPVSAFCTSERDGNNDTPTPGRGKSQAGCFYAYMVYGYTGPAPGQSTYQLTIPVQWPRRTTGRVVRQLRTGVR